jgi:phosphonate transport system substrate-binding protein
VKAHLADLNEPDFFGELVEEGSHERALAMIKAYEVDGAAIDSTVLERQRLLDPASVQGLRVIATLGPNPAPPLVIRRDIDPTVKARVREATLAMHLDPAGQKLLAAAQLTRFEAVADADYDPIRVADAKAATLRW